MALWNETLTTLFKELRECKTTVSLKTLVRKTSEDGNSFEKVQT